MTRIIMDPELLARLHDLSEPLELCDATGKVLAHVRPTIDWSQYEFLTPEISPEERKRRLESSERRYSTQEVLDRLKEG